MIREFADNRPPIDAAAGGDPICPAVPYDEAILQRHLELDPLELQ